MGWRVLDNATTYLVRGGDTLSLSGISYDTALVTQQHNAQLPDYNWGATYADVDKRHYNITLAHIPQLWESIVATGYGDLVLSGHVHSMQIKLHLFGHDFSPASLVYKHWSGRYQHDDRTLYVNDGIGYVGFPFRWGAYPEITLFTLQSIQPCM
jgi:hypothetical protein